MKKNQNGSAHGLILLVVVVVVVAAIGWLVYHKHGTTDNSSASKLSSAGAGSQTSQSRTASNVSTAPAISLTSDLDKALQVLDQNDPSTANSTDTNQLSSQSSF